MTDERHHASDSSEASAGPKVDERARLENKPIIQWTREDWQLWAAGLTESRRLSAADQPAPLEPVEDHPLPSEPAADQPPEPVRKSPEQAPEPVLAEDAPSADTVDLSVDTEEPASQSTAVTLEAEAQDPPAEVQEPQSSQRPERESTASPSSSDASVTQRWTLRPPAPVRSARLRARSAMSLVMLAVAVGALVAGLVTFVILVSGLVLQRALGS